MRLDYQTRSYYPMKRKIRNVIAYVVIAIASYLIAINFMFQLWSSLLLTGFVFMLCVALYNDLSPLLLEKKVECLLIISFLVIIAPPMGVGSIEYEDSSYPPYTIIPDSKIEMPLFFYPKYFHTDHFTGIASHKYKQIIQFDLNENELKTYDFSSSISEIQSYAYFGSYLYVSGSCFNQETGQYNQYCIMRVNLETDEVESFMTGNEPYQVHNLYNLLLISRIHPDNGTRVYELYDIDFTMVGTLYDVPSSASVDNVFNDGDYSVLFLGSRRYDLYFQGSFVRTLISYDHFRAPTVVCFHDDHIYINSGIRIDGEYVIKSFDMTGREVEIHFTGIDGYSSLIFGEDYLIISGGTYLQVIGVWNGSSIHDYNGNLVSAPDEDSDTLKIVEINHTLYGYLDGLYRLKEHHYPVLLRFDRPQKNAVYYLSFVAVFLLILNTDQPLWKKKNPKSTRESSNP